MTDTLERTDIDAYTMDELAPKCCLIASIFGVKMEKCENTAVWVGFTPCCGESALVCQEHYETRHKRPFRCRCGRTHADLINWAPL